MKKSVTLFLSFFTVIFSYAQWSNTTNQFYDSLHMPAAAAANTQENAIVVKSYPDSGYFVIWEDHRTTGNQSDIYAQKYDKNGTALWATNGIAVAATANNEIFAPATYAGTDPRYRSHACTDSAGGFYVAWENPDNGNSDVRAQHVLPEGSHRFADSGFVLVKRASPTDPLNYLESQVVADGRKGCFISFIKLNRYGGVRDLYVQNYRDENGNMVYHGGGQMDVYAEAQIVSSPCGNRGEVIFPDANIKDYQIYPDGQGGCNAVFAYYLYSPAVGATYGLVGFNQMCRVKKESHVMVRRRSGYLGAVGSLLPYKDYSYTLRKDSVVQLYNFTQFTFTSVCSNADVTNYQILDHGNGFLQVSDGTQEAEFAKGVIAATDGAANINANLIAASVKASRASGYNWYKRMLVLPQEVYDSIPYQLSSDTVYIGSAYKLTPDAPLDKINEGYDILLGPDSYEDYDFALSVSRNRIFAAGRIDGPTNSLDPLPVKLAQLQVDRVSPDSFAVRWHTPAGGTVIGIETNGNPAVYYKQPLISTDERGNALFTIVQNDRRILVSPIADSARLVWSALGTPIGSGYVGTQSCQVYTPYVATSSADGTAVIAWSNLPSFSPTGQDIYIRHLDSLNYYNYLPPQKGVASLTGGSGANGSPATLLGLTRTWNYFDGVNTTTGTQSLVAAVYDDYNLGVVTALAYDNPFAVRRYTGIPYLDRNYTINAGNNTNGGAVEVRLYFTTAQFAALQAADATILSPGDLVVIKQPKGTLTTPPATYTPVAGEELIAPVSWAAVSGGYFIQLPVSTFSYFFIKKNDAILPVKWVSVSAERKNNTAALVSWTVANEVNVKNYIVQYSEDGVHYKDGCVADASGLATYHCTLAINANQYFIKIKETDLEGRTGYSSTAVVDALRAVTAFIVSPNPVRGNAWLRYTVSTPAKALLRLMAANGTTVWQQSATLSRSGALSMPLNGLPAGTYNLQISTGKERQVLKIVKE